MCAVFIVKDCTRDEVIEIKMNEVGSKTMKRQASEAGIENSVPTKDVFATPSQAHWWSAIIIINKNDSISYHSNLSR